MCTYISMYFVPDSTELFAFDVQQELQFPDSLSEFSKVRFRVLSLNLGSTFDADNRVFVCPDDDVYELRLHMPCMMEGITSHVHCRYVLKSEQSVDSFLQLRVDAISDQNKHNLASASDLVQCRQGLELLIRTNGRNVTFPLAAVPRLTGRKVHSNSSKSSST